MIYLPLTRQNKRGETMNKESIQELEDFLAGTFHQDISNPDEALDDYINSVDVEWLNIMMSIISEFIESNISEEKKNKIITDNVEIYFPSLNMIPIEWLSRVLSRIDMFIQSIDKDMI